jgi:hypothetical protein
MRAKTLTTVVAGLLTFAGATFPVHSATLPATAGHGWPFVFDVCLVTSGFQISSQCTGVPRKLIIPGQTVTAGSQTPSVWASGDGGSSRTICNARTLTSTGEISAISQDVTTSPSANPQQLIMSTVSVPAGGTIHFECDIQLGARLISVDFH